MSRRAIGARYLANAGRATRPGPPALRSTLAGARSRRAATQDAIDRRNREAARVIASEPERYGPESLLARWAALVLSGEGGADGEAGDDRR